MMSLARDFEKLTSANYHNWKFDMRMVLIGKDLWDIVSGDDVLDENASEADRTHYRRRDQKAMSNICLAISSELKIYVRNAKTSKEAWDELANHFEEKTLSRKINFRRQLYNCKLTGEMTMVQHINNIKTISEHLEALDNPVSEEDLVMILFTSVPEDYNNLVTTLETLKEEKLTWVYVRDRLITEYERKRVVKDELEETQKHGEVHGALFAGAKSNKPEFRCHYCNKQGHFIKNCYERKRDEAEQRRRDVEDEKKKMTKKKLQHSVVPKLKVKKTMILLQSLHCTSVLRRKRKTGCWIRHVRGTSLGVRKILPTTKSSRPKKSLNMLYWLIKVWSRLKDKVT